MTETIKFTKNGQWSLGKGEDHKDGTNQRLANPSEKALHDGRGRIHMVEGKKNKKDDHGKPVQGNEAKGFAENSGPSRNSGHGAL